MKAIIARLRIGLQCKTFTFFLLVETRLNTLFSLRDIKIVEY